MTLPTKSSPSPAVAGPTGYSISPGPSATNAHPRSIRSFVMRGGRITEAQQRALGSHWPRYGIAFEPAPLDFAVVFGRRAPVTLEIGFGNGDNLVTQAAAHPERNYLGIEVHRPGVGHLLLRLDERQLRHVRIICHDAVEVLAHQVAPQTLDEIQILFPDPWPKKRHHKRRLVQGPFVELLADRLRLGGLLRFATDWRPYADAALELLNANPRLRNLAPNRRFVPRPIERSATRFEQRGERLGHDVWDLAFERQ